MLQNIRNNIQGTAAKVVIAIIVVPFALFGIDSLFSGSAQPPAAIINGEDVSEAELQQAITMQKRRLIGMMGDQVDPAMLDDAVLRKPALDSLIKQQLLLQAAADAGIEVSNQQLNSVIAGMPQFHEDGRFSQERYQQVLRLQGYSSALFKQLLRSDLIIQQLSASMASSAFITADEVDKAIGFVHETRDFHVIELPLSGFLDSVTVSDDEMKAYYDANPQQFQSEPKVKLSYIEIKEEQFYEPVSEKQVQAEYQRYIASLDSSAEREAAHILLEVNDERDRKAAIAELTALKARIEAGDSFADVAKAESEDVGSSSDGGYLGFTAGDSFPPEFEDALAALEVGEISQPVETEAGVHLIKLVSVKEGEVPSLDESRLEITERLRRQKAQPVMVSTVESLRDLVFNAENLRMPAEELGVKVQQSEWLSQSSNDSIFAHEQVRRAAFSAELREQGLNSEVIELSPEHYIVVHVDDYQAPATLAYDDVRENIKVTLRRKKAEAIASKTATELREKIAKGESAEALAKARSYTFSTNSDIKRSDISVDGELRQRVFSLAAPTASQPSLGLFKRQNGDYIVLQLLAVEQGSRAQLTPKAIADVERSVMRSASSQAFSAYFNTLWTEAEVKIN